MPTIQRPRKKLLWPTKLGSQRKFLIACSAHRSKLNHCVILLAPDSFVTRSKLYDFLIYLTRPLKQILVIVY